ncbi:MAG: sensor histidine kinase [Burkholderiales bacterium]|nr:sensor histidine kinase [Burkholderiales bacterium]
MKLPTAVPARTPASLRRRLLLQVALPLLGLFALDGALSAWAAHYYANHVYDRWLSDSAQSLAQQVRVTGGRAALNLPRAAQEMFEWDAEDRIVFRVEGSQSGVIAGRDVPLAGRNEERLYNARFYDAPIAGHEMRWVRLDSPLPPLGEEVTVTVGETMRKRDRLADELLLWVWVPQVLLLLVAGYIAYRAIVVQTDRLHALSVSLRDMSYRELSAVPGENMPAEMQPLVEALNALIGKLDAAALAHRSFIANAAHQLRTPLTTLSLTAEQALHCERIEDMRDAVARVQSAVQRATRLANQLLLLSRAEPEAQSGAARRRTDLYELAFDTASAWVPAAVAAGIDLGFDETSAHVTAEVDAALVAEAINNLLDNALKYCPPRTRVTVSVRELPEPAIVVEDTGPGIAPAERSRVVQRFSRGDHATRGGTGLGLAIANEIALAHAGRFVITDTPGGGARFEIRL